MRRIALFIAGVLVAALLVALPAIGSDGTSGDYKVRGIFDNGSFVVNGEQVRVAGANVGTVESVDVTGNDEIASDEGGPHPVPGKAVVVMNITDPGFKDFRSDASCLIRPQSLIGEKYVDCTPTQPRAPGTPPPPELQQIADGQPGAGQFLLPLENNGKTVDLDLIQNIQRLPYADRFRIILNDLGASLAGRGQDLGEVIDRANPALRQTDRVLAILAQQSRQLASLASNGDAVLKPLAENRTHVTGFFHNAAISGAATAERSADLEESLRKFPETLHQVRLTMTQLKSFSDKGLPFFTALNQAAPGLSKATVNLPNFARLSIPALTSLGDAAQSSGPKLVASDGLLTDLVQTANSSVPIGNNFSAFLDTFTKTGGFQNLMDFIYNSVGATNGIDAIGHFLRSNLQLTSCVEVAVTVQSGCEAFFRPTATPTTTQKKGKKSKARKARTKIRPGNPNLPLPPIDVPDLSDLLPPPAPSDQGDDSSSDESGSGSDAGSGTTTTVPDTGTTTQPQGDQAVSMKSARMFLNFLLGGGA
ncbi:MAG TPA: MlaD family protein [Solirubrobacterales bacterium]|nr:MlaD family protein [Solirubrobacterales bacterium]